MAIHVKNLLVHVYQHSSFLPRKKDLEIDLIDQYLYEALIDYNDYNKKLLQQLLLRSLALEVTSVRQQALSSSSLQIQNNC